MRVIGVDGGGTRTRCVVTDEQGQVLGSGERGSSNYHSVGLERSRANLEGAITDALKQSSLALAQIDAAFLGLSGVHGFEDVERMTAVVRSFGLRKNVTVDCDAVVALAGAVGGGPGAVVISGTGSLAYGESPTGERATAGGWGPAYGDEGSGYEIGRRAIAAVLRAHDGRGAKTLLTSTIPSALGLRDVHALTQMVRQPRLERAEVAALTPHVGRAALDADPVAQRILADAGAELGKAVVAVLSRLGMCIGEPDVSYVGTVFEQTAFLKEAMTGVIHHAVPGARIRPPRLPPVVGAALLALRSARGQTSRADSRSGFHNLSSPRST